MKYCRELRLDGYSDWRLASLAELKGIYDEKAQSSGFAGKQGKEPSTWHVKGGLLLTGNQWTSTRVPNERGRAAGYAYRFDLNEGRTFDGDEIDFTTFKRALCVRGIGDPLGWQRNQADQSP